MSDLYIKKIRRELKMTQQKFADMLDVSKSLVQKWESGERIPDDEVLNTLDRIKNTQKHTKEEVVSIDMINKGVPYYDVDFAGGWDSEEIFSNHMPAFYISSPDFMKAQFACNLFGNSISNRIPSGAIIGLREIFDWQTYFPTNELYAVLTKNDLRTVKIVKRSQKDGYLTLIPDPKDQYNQIGYEPEEIPIEFISKFYQVVAWAQFERVAM